MSGPDFPSVVLSAYEQGENGEHSEILVDPGLRDSLGSLEGFEFEDLRGYENCSIDQERLSPFQGGLEAKDGSDCSSSLKKLGNSLPSLIGQQVKNPIDKRFRRVNSKRINQGSNETPSLRSSINGSDDSGFLVVEVVSMNVDELGARRMRNRKRSQTWDSKRLSELGANRSIDPNVFRRLSNRGPGSGTGSDSNMSSSGNTRAESGVLQKILTRYWIIWRMLICQSRKKNRMK